MVTTLKTSVSTSRITASRRELEMRNVAFAVCLLLSLGLATALISAEQARKISIRGRITDFFGAPIADTLVEVAPENSAQRFSATSDEEGGYSLKDLPAVPLTVTFKARGFRQEEVRVSPQEGEQLLLDAGLEIGVLSNIPPTLVAGVVRQSVNTPLADATVTVVNPFNPRFSERARTDKAGRYKIKLAFPGQYIMYAAKPGFKLNAEVIIIEPSLSIQHRVADMMLMRLSQ
jgi:hypothetical protein